MRSLLGPASAPEFALRPLATDLRMDYRKDSAIMKLSEQRLPPETLKETAETFEKCSEAQIGLRMAMEFQTKNLKKSALGR
jgi:hypothetical protein